MDPFTLDWPDDTDGQGQCIRHLAEIAANPALPYEMQTWAYDKLEEGCLVLFPRSGA